MTSMTLTLILATGAAVIGLLLGYILGKRQQPQDFSELKGALDATLAQQSRTETALREELASRLGSVGDKTQSAITILGDRTQNTLSQLTERLAVIDSAQRQMGSLSTEVTDLRMLLSNKQTRGAFGEMRLNDILKNVLPPNAYAIQHTLSNGKRVDALVMDSHSSSPLSVDAKFPLESYRQILDAQSREDKEKARRAFRADMMTHIKAVSEKYIIPGETGESALLFLPAESIYMELHEHFEDVVEESMRRCVWIVSPTTLMAVLITLRGIARDSLIFKEADRIRKELTLLSKDVGRLLDRSSNLARHFEQVHGDLDGISISAEKIKKRADTLASLDFED